MANWDYLGKDRGFLLQLAVKNLSFRQLLVTDFIQCSVNNRKIESSIYRLI